ncbi:hypothetical protein JCM8547_004044 [Rhodosporidiobolus lusitaniae]
MHRSSRHLALLLSRRAVPSPSLPSHVLPSLLPPSRPPLHPSQPLFRPSSSSSAPPPPSKEHLQLKTAAEGALRRALEGTEEGGVERQKKEKEVEPLRRAVREVEEAEELIATLHDLAASELDPDLRSLALDDLPSAHLTLTSTLSSLRSLLLPPSPESSLSALLEFKPGVGGSESTLFAAELVRMYTRLSARKGWRANVVESVGVEGLASGTAFKEALVEVSGEGAYGYLRREAGVHRVQRVPETETKGRVHSSTVAVLVLPSESANQQINESDLYDLKDVKIETMRSRGAGGQHVNRTESAIRLTHSPTGVTVSMQDSRSQHENRSKAFKVLTSRLLALKLNEQEVKRRSQRRGQVSGTDRSDKVRTYSFSQGRITDHRIPLTLPGLEDALEGGETLDFINDGLAEKEEGERLDELLAAGEGS